MHVALQHRLDDAVGEYHGAGIQRFDVDSSRLAFEEAHHVDHLDAGHFAIEDVADGEVAAPIADGDDDLVGAQLPRQVPERALQRQQLLRAHHRVLTGYRHVAEQQHILPVRAPPQALDLRRQLAGAEDHHTAFEVAGVQVAVDERAEYADADRGQHEGHRQGPSADGELRIESADGRHQQCADGDGHTDAQRDLARIFAQAALIEAGGGHDQHHQQDIHQALGPDGTDQQSGGGIDPKQSDADRRVDGAEQYQCLAGAEDDQTPRQVMPEYPNHRAVMALLVESP